MNSHDIVVKLKDIDRQLAVSILRRWGHSWREIATLFGYKSAGWSTRIVLLSEEEIQYRLLSLFSTGQINVSEYNSLIQKNKPQTKKGRPKALSDEHIVLLQKIIADPKTQHLSCSQIYKIFSQRVSDPPSYHTVYRFLLSMPEIYKRKPRERYLHAHHPTSSLPGEIWLVDRFRSDVFVLDPLTGEAMRPECIVVIDKATRAILAIGAAYRPNEATQKKRFHYDAHLAGAALLQAVRGELTGAPHFPNKLIIDFGKVEGSQRIIDYLNYHGVVVEKARPYTPHDKAEIEGGVIAHIHSQLEAYLPGYCGPDNRKDVQPACWSGKPQRVVTAKGIYYTDAAGRPLLDIDEFNKELQKFAHNWNEQPTSDDIRYRHLPRIARLKHATENNELQSRLHYAETYLLPGAPRRVAEDGTIRVANRVYYHPCLIALRTLYGKEAKVYVRYSFTCRDTVYLYCIDPYHLDEAPTEWLWMWEAVGTSGASHPWERSQATIYKREAHREDDPRHTDWVNLVRAVNQAARRAANDLRQNPISEPRFAFNYIAASIWRVVEQHIGVNSAQGDGPLRGVDVGGSHKDGEGQSTDARPALINAQNQKLWDVEMSFMQWLQQKADKWRLQARR